MNEFLIKVTYFLFIVLLCFKSQLTTGQRNHCKNNSEICVPVKRCLSINDRLYNDTLSQNEVEDLRNSQCGYKNGTVYVCCKSSLPQAPNCGPISLSTRIVGGSVTHIQEYPWTVLVGKAIGTDNDAIIKYICGGSLINDQYILTAAHCIKIESIKNPGQIAIRRIRKIRLGEWNLDTGPIDTEIDPDTNEIIEGEPVVDMNIAETIVHEKYHPNSKFYDIALIKLSEKVNFTRFIQPICLPDINQQINNNLTVVGWGQTENETRSLLKRYAIIPKWNLTKCSEIYEDKFDIKINSMQLCAGGTKGIDSCSGDSGGSLVGFNSSNPFKIYSYIAGIVSFGSRHCGDGILPGIYTDVKSYLTWIYDNIDHAG